MTQPLRRHFRADGPNYPISGLDRRAEDKRVALAPLDNTLIPQPPIRNWDDYFKAIFPEDARVTPESIRDIADRENREFREMNDRELVEIYNQMFHIPAIDTTPEPQAWHGEQTLWVADVDLSDMSVKHVPENEFRKHESEEPGAGLIGGLPAPGSVGS